MPPSSYLYRTDRIPCLKTSNQFLSQKHCWTLRHTEPLFDPKTRMLASKTDITFFSLKPGLGMKPLIHHNVTSSAIDLILDTLNLNLIGTLEDCRKVSIFDVEVLM